MLFLIVLKEDKQPPNETRLVQLHLILDSTKCGYGIKATQSCLCQIRKRSTPDIDTCSFEDRQQTAVPLERCDLQTLKRNNHGR